MVARSRGAPRPLLASLALFLVLAAAQLGPLAPSAAAIPPPERRFCEPLGAIDVEVLQDGAKLEWICVQDFEFDNDPTSEFWRWEFYRFTPGPSQKQHGSRVSSSPPYRMHIDSAVGTGVGGGDAVGAIWINNPNGTALNRRIAVHTIMEYAPSPTSSYINCHDLGWVEAPTQRSFWRVAIKQYSQPDCGQGYYRAQVAGRFLATSTNTWQTSSWHYSPAVFIRCTDPSCQ